LVFAALAAGCNAGDAAGPGLMEERIGDEARSVGYYDHGHVASAEEIAGWDIDIRPDGLGLPPGGATPEDGEMLYEELCASCHGSFGEGVGRYPILSGGEGTLTEPRPERTVGSYWPYASTVWDYIHRAMPFTEPESLTDEETYAITAYVLYLNDLVEYYFEVNQGNLASIEMPNKDGFFLDDRPDVAAVRCMENCKDPASIEISSEPELVTAEDGEKVSDPVAKTSPGRTVYDQACAMCHATGVGDAPVTGVAADWTERLATGRDALVASVISGKGIMPPKGGQLQLSDDEVAAAVDHMISAATD
jgi:cytochrome c